MKIAPDKKLHIIVGFLIAAVVGFVLNPVAGFTAGCVAGIAKEVYDNLSGKGTPEINDALATVAGSILGAGFSFLALTYGVPQL